MGKHGNLLRREAHPTVRKNYRRYATSGVKEVPISLEVPKPEKKQRVKKKVVLLDHDHCTLCGTCVDLCHWNALKIQNEELLINEELCRGCGLCVKKCTAQVLGLQIKGRIERTETEVQKETRIQKETGEVGQTS